MSTTEPAKGHAPKRRRGYLRVAAILEAAAELFTEKGYDATTMTEVAARSGTAIASLYRFFPAKDALADALLLQYATHALEGLRALGARAGAMTLGELAGGLIEFRLALQSERRFAVGLAEVRGASEERRQQFREAMLEGIGTILRDAIPTLPAKRVGPMSAVLLNTLKSVAAVGEQKPAMRRALLDETKTMIGSYLVAAAAADRDD